MALLYFVLLLLALVCFAVATKQGVAAKFQLVPLGLALVTAVFMLQQLQRL